jgi:hypothetical protein
MAGLSVGGAAASGLESGIGLGMRLRQQELAEQNDKRQVLLADAQLQRQREADKRLEEDRALDAINKEFDDLRSEGEGYLQQYGGMKNIPQDIAGTYKTRADQVSSSRNTLLRKRYDPVVRQMEQRAKDSAMQLQSGRLSIDEMSPGDLYQMVAVQARRDPADLIGRDGKPSKVSAAVADIMDGLEFKNEGAVLRGANVLLEPELKIGLGETSPHGGIIVGKQIVKLIPHPSDPNKVLPVVKVYVRSGAAKTDGAEMSAEEGAPLGATGYYIAPVTENRSSDPNDPPRAIDMQKAMDYAAQMQTLSTAIGNPALAAKMDQGRKEAGASSDDFLKAFYSVRGRMPAKAPVEYKAVSPGQRLVGIDTSSGKPTGEVIEGAPREKPRATGLAANIQAVQDYAEEQGVSEAEAAISLQQQGLLRAPKGGKVGRGTGGGSGGGGLTGPAPPKGATGQALLDSLSEDDAIVVEGLANGSIKPSEISQKGNRREKMLALAKRFDSTSDFGPSGKLKDVPAPAQKALLENNTNLERATRALRLLGAGGPAREGETIDAEATGLKGYLPNQVLNRLDPKGVEARAAIADLGSLVIHDRSGAAVTVSEFPRLAPFVPTEKDDADAARKKLRGFVRVFREEMDALQGTYGPDNGYREFKVGGSKGPGVSALPDTDRRQSGQVGREPAAASPQRLPADSKAAAAAYNKLPSGATYIDPNGVTRTKK